MNAVETDRAARILTPPTRSKCCLADVRESTDCMALLCDGCLGTIPLHERLYVDYISRAKSRILGRELSNHPLSYQYSAHAETQVAVACGAACRDCIRSVFKSGDADR